MNSKITVLDGGADGRRYQVDLSETELGLMSDLLNSVNDLRAVPLRQAVDNIIRANNAFILLQETVIVKCENCKGTGSVKHNHEYSNSYIKNNCSKCRGEGQKVKILTTRFEPLSPSWKEQLTPMY